MTDVPRSARRIPRGAIPTHFMHASAADVCARLANVALGRSTPSAREHDDFAPLERNATLGTITLHAHQQDALVRINNALDEFGGALLADAVGLGKTYVALAVAQQYETAHVLAPAALLDMWKQAIAKAGIANVTVHSLHALSRAPTALPFARRSLVIIDEAHHLRNHTTARYKNVLPVLQNRHVLLLSATPLHNSARELRSLLALFLGNRPDVLAGAVLARCIIRRMHDTTTGVPTVVTHAPFPLPDNPPILEQLLTLPPALPLAQGSAASALIRIGLLRAWCSSDAALTTAVRRRLTRGEALLHSLHHGRYPTQRELRSWISDDSTVQLGFPELLVNKTSTTTPLLLKTLLAHLDALNALLQLHTRSSTADAERIARLRGLLTADAGRVLLRGENEPVHSIGDAYATSVRPPILAFSQFASTVRYLFRALSDLAGVAALTADGGHIASGGISRNELIANFAPNANGRPPPPAHNRIRLLLATDVLSEGVNLQDAATVFHLDWPWTDALRQQRVGRLARLGSPHAFVHALAFAPPMGAEAALHLLATLERKARLYRSLIGRTSTRDTAVAPNHDASMSAPDQASELLQWWRNWRDRRAETGIHDRLAAFDPVPAAHIATAPVATAPIATPPVAVARGIRQGWLAAISIGDAQLVVAHCARPVMIATVKAGATGDEGGTAIAHRRGGTSRTGVDISLVHQMVRSVRDANVPPARTAGADSTIESSVDCADEHAYEHATAELDDWFATHQIQSLAGARRTTLAPTQQRALRMVKARFQSLTAAHRASVSASHSRVEHSLRHVRGAAAEEAIQQWLDSSVEFDQTNSLNSVSLERWFAAFPFTTSMSAPPLAPPKTRRDDWRVLALLLIHPNGPPEY